MRIKPLTVAEVEYMAFELAQKFMTWNEPIPDFGTRFPNVLESCLATPFTRFNKRDLYRGLVGKAAILFYLMIKNHPFENGNKRIAVMALLYFLYKNTFWFTMDNKQLYRFARQIAASKPEDKESAILTIQGFLQNYLTKLQN